MNLPPYPVLKSNYPSDTDSDAVKQEIGGQVTQDWLGPNTCVIRMCRAFNYAGKVHEIPAHGLSTVRGGDGKFYAYRVSEFVSYLKRKYGAPQVVKSGNEISITPFRDKTGLIVWNIQGWNDATGHFTLWTGSSGVYEGTHHYFQDFPTHKTPGPFLTRVELWIC